METGIEDLNVYGGCAVLDLRKLAQWRDLDADRFEKLLMEQKSVALPFEDPVSFAVNAAQPLIAALPEREKKRIELLIVATESGIDFGKSMSSYVQQYLGLSRNCRTFEVKHACYGGTAAFQMASSFVLSQVSPQAKALVIATDVSRPTPGSYAEPSQGAAAVAMLISQSPRVFTLETGASGCYSYEVMDTCRPEPDVEIGDPDLSLLSYLDCIENSFRAYQERVPHADYQDSFDYIAMHTPFGGMVKGAHRSMMRKFKNVPPGVIEKDFAARVEPSLMYCKKVGNIYSGTIFLALCGLLDTSSQSRRVRIGMFSYGSGCCSEFYSGLADNSARETLANKKIDEHLRSRTELGRDEYDAALRLNKEVGFAAKSKDVDTTPFAHFFRKHFVGRQRLSLKRISGYHREYLWN
jgi:polyketide biosynthesis 3-hydroxy-3-methylglutaryl-CoA synthase-like enzyme PksG